MKYIFSENSQKSEQNCRKLPEGIMDDNRDNFSFAHRGDDFGLY